MTHFNSHELYLLHLGLITRQQKIQQLLDLFDEGTEKRLIDEYNKEAQEFSDLVDKISEIRKSML